MSRIEKEKQADVAYGLALNNTENWETWDSCLQTDIASLL